MQQDLPKPQLEWKGRAIADLHAIKIHRDNIEEIILADATNVDN